MKRCPICGSGMKEETEPCLFCKGRGCRMCENTEGMSIIISCLNKDCEWSE